MQNKNESKLEESFPASQSVNDLPCEDRAHESSCLLEHTQEQPKPSAKYEKIVFVVLFLSVSLAIMCFCYGEKNIVLVKAGLASFKTPWRKNKSEVAETPFIVYSKAGREALTKIKPTLAKEFFNKALIEIEKERGPASASRGVALSNLYLTSELTRDWDEAERFAIMLEQNERNFQGSRSARLADAFCMHAKISFNKKDPDSAMRLLDSAYGIYQRACDPGSPRFEKLMVVKSNNGYSFDFIPTLYVSHKEPRGDWNQLPAAHFRQLALVEFINPSYDRAEEILRKYEECIRIGKDNAKTGCDEQCTATIMNDYACFLRTLGRVSEAKLIEAKVDAIRIKHYGSLPPIGDK